MHRYAPVGVPKRRTSFTLFMVALLFTVRSASFAAGQGHNCVFLRSGFRVRRSSFARAPSCTARRTATSARRPLDRIVAKEVRRTSMSCTGTCCRAGGPRDFFDLPDTSQGAHRPIPEHCAAIASDGLRLRECLKPDSTLRL